MLGRIKGTRVGVVLVLILALALAVGLVGCIPINPAPAVTPSPTPAPTLEPAPSTPTLTQLSFTLSLEPEKDYDEYTIPIYIKPYQTLHLKWHITEGGDFLWIAFETPNGKAIGMRADGGFNDYWPQPPACELLSGGGNIIFSPSEFDWGEGYYYFFPHLTTGTTTKDVTVEVFYWIAD